MIYGKTSDIIARRSLLAVYKSFVRPCLDYGDILDDNLRKGESQKETRKKS